jgi:hypothetical protein
MSQGTGGPVMSTTITPVLSERESAYNAYLASLDETELDAYLRCNNEVGEFSGVESLELFFHDMFVAGTIHEDTIGAKILELLGEI